MKVGYRLGTGGERGTGLGLERTGLRPVDISEEEALKKLLELNLELSRDAGAK